MTDAAHLGLHGELPHRVARFGIPDFVKDVGGVFKGAAEQLVDTGSGIVDAVSNPIDTAKGIGSLVTDPKKSWPALWHGIADPITEDWKNGNPGEAIGRGLFGILEAVVGTKGVTKVTKVVKHVPDVPDVPRPPVKPKPDGPDVPNGPDKPPGGPKKPPPGGPKKTPITPSAELLQKTFGDLSDADAAFAKNLNVQHVFHGDSFGGMHVATGPGKFDGITVVETSAKSGRTWKADVTYEDVNGVLVTKPSTMFPKEWTPTEVLQSIQRADGNAERTARPTFEEGGRKVDTYEGTDRGLKIVIRKDADTGEILTAFPKQQDKLPTDVPE
jgi:hypothetical protein